MEQSKAHRGFVGSPRIGKAAQFLIKNNTLSRTEALKLAGYSNKDSRCKKII